MWQPPWVGPYNMHSELVKFQAHDGLVTCFQAFRLNMIPILLACMIASLLAIHDFKPISYGVKPSGFMVTHSCYVDLPPHWIITCLVGISSWLATCCTWVQAFRLHDTFQHSYLCFRSSQAFVIHTVSGSVVFLIAGLKKTRYVYANSSEPANLGVRIWFIRLILMFRSGLKLCWWVAATQQRMTSSVLRTSDQWSVRLWSPQRSVQSLPGQWPWAKYMPYIERYCTALYRWYSLRSVYI